MSDKESNTIEPDLRTRSASLSAPMLYGIRMHSASQPAAWNPERVRLFLLCPDTLHDEPFPVALLDRIIVAADG
jgi:hypothetical protein